MKIAGLEIEAPSVEILVIPRDKVDVIIRAKPIMNYDEFDKLCPEPKPPVKIYPKQGEVEDVNDPKFKKAHDEWAESKGHYMFIESLSATKDLEWATIDMSDSSTWSNYENELKAIFTPGEVYGIQSLVMTVCGLNSDRMDEATKSFLAAQAVAPSE